LIQVLDAFAPTVPGIFLYYPGGRQVLPKLRAFIDHVKKGTDRPAVHGNARRKG
jgi:DNA-binding transcriptional LysR family regulator